MNSAMKGRAKSTTENAGGPVKAAGESASTKSLKSDKGVTAGPVSGSTSRDPCSGKKRSAKDGVASRTGDHLLSQAKGKATSSKSKNDTMMGIVSSSMATVPGKKKIATSEMTLETADSLLSQAKRKATSQGLKKLPRPGLSQEPWIWLRAPARKRHQRIK